MLYLKMNMSSCCSVGKEIYQEQGDLFPKNDTGLSVTSKNYTCLFEQTFQSYVEKH